MLFYVHKEYEFEFPDYYVCEKCEYLSIKLADPIIGPLIIGNDSEESKGEKQEERLAYGDHTETWIPTYRLWDVEFSLIEQIFLARIWKNMAKGFKKSPVMGDIITNHLKDYKLSALNLARIKNSFDKEVSSMMCNIMTFYEENKSKIEELKFAKIQNVITDNHTHFDTKANEENDKKIAEMKEIF